MMQVHGRHLQVAMDLLNAAKIADLGSDSDDDRDSGQDDTEFDESAIPALQDLEQTKPRLRGVMAASRISLLISQTNL